MIEDVGARLQFIWRVPTEKGNEIPLATNLDPASFVPALSKDAEDVLGDIRKQKQEKKHSEPRSFGEPQP